MNLFKNLLGSICIIAAISTIFLHLLKNLNDKNNLNSENDLQSPRMLKYSSIFDRLKEKEKLKPIDESSCLFESEYDLEEHTVSLKINPKENIYPSLTNWTVSWSAPHSNVASNSWIGVYPYAQAPTFLNGLDSFTIDSKLRGERTLQAPKDAGVYEIRYIQDNNLHTISSIGPLIVNPPDVFLTVSNFQAGISEKVFIAWEFSNESLHKFKFGKNGKSPLGTYLCLNVIGSNDLDDCYWSKELTEHKGVQKIKLPSFAGYFVIRIVIQYQTWRVDPELECLAVSQIIKVSNPNFKLTPHRLHSVVGSVTSTNWKVQFASKNDWIGFYSLETSEIFTRSANPIQSFRVKGQLEGTFQSFIPPNYPAGPYVFIYFSNHVPVAVSDRINLQQPKVGCPAEKKTMSNIKHLIIICTENHSFDSYFGSYCKGEENSNPDCNYGADCCEKAPEILQGLSPVVLNDTQNKNFDPNHDQECERCEINGGRMDGYVKGCYCSNQQNFAIADHQSVKVIHDYAKKYSISDRYFQATAGASSQNDMFFARASYVFKDNAKIPIGSIGSNCWYLQHGIPDEIAMFYDPSITSLLDKCDFVLKSYAEGYRNASMSFENNKCYPDGYGSGDIPFGYYAGVTDHPRFMADYEDFKSDIINGTLADVSFIKPLGINTGHPMDANITAEMNFIKNTVEYVLNSSYAEDTLIIWVPDESGGFYDHIKPPKTNNVDGIPYGPRIPVLAMGKFAKKNYISHVTMEHSSVVKFIEWNWLNGKTGQLNTRDTDVNSIGDLIDPFEAGIEVPN
jgi:phospholipase C